MSNNNLPVNGLKQFENSSDYPTPEQQSLSEEVRQTLEQLNKEDDSPTLDEARFVAVFLPFFAGDEVLPYPVDIGTWEVLAAKSSYNKVRIVDANNKVLFTVPPILDRNAVRTLGQTGSNSIMHVVERAKQLSMHSPLRSKEFLQEQLRQRALIMHRSPSVIQNLKIWNEIFARYNRPAITIPDVSEEELKRLDPALAANAPSNVGKSASSSGDDIEYEEL